MKTFIENKIHLNKGILLILLYLICTNISAQKYKKLFESNDFEKLSEKTEKAYKKDSTNLLIIYYKSKLYAYHQPKNLNSSYNFVSQVCNDLYKITDNKTKEQYLEEDLTYYFANNFKQNVCALILDSIELNSSQLLNGYKAFINTFRCDINEKVKYKIDSLEFLTLKNDSNISKCENYLNENDLSAFKNEILAIIEYKTFQSLELKDFRENYTSEFKRKFPKSIFLPQVIYHEINRKIENAIIVNDTNTLNSLEIAVANIEQNKYKYQLQTSINNGRESIYYKLCVEIKDTILIDFYLKNFHNSIYFTRILTLLDSVKNSFQFNSNVLEQNIIINSNDLSLDQCENDGVSLKHFLKHRFFKKYFENDTASLFDQIGRIYEDINSSYIDDNEKTEFTCYIPYGPVLRTREFNGYKFYDKISSRYILQGYGEINMFNDSNVQINIKPFKQIEFTSISFVFLVTDFSGRKALFNSRKGIFISKWIYEIEEFQISAFHPTDLVLRHLYKDFYKKGNIFIGFKCYELYAKNFKIINTNGDNIFINTKIINPFYDTKNEVFINVSTCRFLNGSYSSGLIRFNENDGNSGICDINFDSIYFKSKSQFKLSNMDEFGNIIIEDTKTMRSKIYNIHSRSFLSSEFDKYERINLPDNWGNGKDLILRDGNTNFSYLNGFRSNFDEESSLCREYNYFGESNEEFPNPGMKTQPHKIIYKLEKFTTIYLNKKCSICDYKIITHSKLIDEYGNLLFEGDGNISKISVNNGYIIFNINDFPIIINDKKEIIWNPRKLYLVETLREIPFQDFIIYGTINENGLKQLGVFNLITKQNITPKYENLIISGKSLIGFLNGNSELIFKMN